MVGKARGLCVRIRTEFEHVLFYPTSKQDAEERSLAPVCRSGRPSWSDGRFTSWVEGVPTYALDARAGEPLFEALGSEAGHVIVFGGIADLDGIAAHFTIFDIDLMRNGKVQDHGDLFAAVRAHESVFHRAIGYDRV